MKVATTLVLVLALLTAGLMAGANVMLYGETGNVTIQWETVAGDPVAAEGLEVCLPLEYDGQLFWNTTFPAGRPEEASTRLSHFFVRQNTSPEYQAPPLEVDVKGNLGIGYGVSHSSYSYGDSILDSLIQVVADNTPEGGEHTQEFNLSDYYTTWPLSVWASCQQWMPPEEQLSELFNAYFPIPVPKDYSITITVEKSGSSRSSTISMGGPYQFSWDTWSQERAEDVIFVLNNSYYYYEEESGSHHLMDGSGIPGGWGIYRLAAEKDSNSARIETLYSLPQDSRILEFWGAEDGSQFFLLTREEGQLRLRIFDEAVQLTQTLDLLALDEAESYFQTYHGEDFLVPMVYGPRSEGYSYRFAVVGRDERGWSIHFTGDDMEASNLGFKGFSWLNDSWSPVDLAYDGRRLAVRDTVSGYRSDLAFYVAVYTAQGLEYLGAYNSSLSLPALPEASYLDFYYDTPLIYRAGGDPLVAWTGETAP